MTIKEIMSGCRVVEFKQSNNLPAELAIVYPDGSFKIADGVDPSIVVKQLIKMHLEQQYRINQLEDACDEAIAFCELLNPVAQTPNIPELIAKNLRKAKEAKL